MTAEDKQHCPGLLAGISPAKPVSGATVSQVQTGHQALLNWHQQHCSYSLQNVKMPCSHAPEPLQHRDCRISVSHMRKLRCIRTISS